MDELTWKWAFGPYLDPPEGQKESAIKAGYVKVYLAEHVDAVIAKLKQELEDVQASMYVDVVDANMENRKLRRALWMARALRARDIQRWWIAVTFSKTTERACSVWNNVERKCRAKAEEYK